MLFGLYLLFNSSVSLSQEVIPVRVAAVSMWSDTNAAFNLARIDSFSAIAAGDSAVLVVFPEACLQHNPGWGYITHIPTAEELDYLHRTAETIPGPSTAALEGIAARLGLTVVVGMTEVDSAGEHYYNTAVIVGPGGYIGKYRKVNLWDASSLGNEHLCWDYGDRGYAAFDTPAGRIGILICADMRIDEAIDSVVALGAEMIAALSGWPVAARVVYLSTTENVAIRSGKPLAVGPQVGEAPNATFGGIARILDETGSPLSETPADSEGVACATVHISTGINQSTAIRPTDFHITAYPNPFNSIVRIDIAGLAPCGVEDYHTRVKIYDINGKLVFSDRQGCLSIQGKEACLYKWQPAPNLPNSAYFIVATCGKTHSCTKVLYLK
ncbi:hypothetical protein JXI42_03115 [bacterium]|nr:hypothetical protein [bacterium]